MPFSKKDLTGDYTWNSDSHESLYTGSPSRRNFNRYSGEQVLFIINSLADSGNSFSPDDIKEIENAIVNKLSIEPVSEITVFNWLKLQKIS